MEDFDKFAHNYKTVLDDSLKLGGEKGGYFCRYKADFITRCVGGDFSGKILDYGCGIGLLSETLLDFLPRAGVDGFDVSTASLEHLPQRLKDQGHFTSEIADLSGDYDLIVVANVLHHIDPSQRQAVISRLRAMVKEGGRMIIFEHNPFNPMTRKIVRESPLDKGVVLLPSSETLAYLKSAGFEDIKYQYIVFFPRPLSLLRWAEPFLSRLALGAQYAAIGQVGTHA